MSHDNRGRNRSDASHGLLTPPPAGHRQPSQSPQRQLDSVVPFQAPSFRKYDRMILFHFYPFLFSLSIFYFVEIFYYFKLNQIVVPFLQIIQK